MSRKSSRRHAFIIIFQKEFHDNFNASLQTNLYLNELVEIEKLSNKERDFIINEVVGAIENLEKIDQLIKDTAIGWDFNRIAKCDIAILRIAIFEILYQDDIAHSISINEAVELAKEYGGDDEDDSHKFINGILAKIVKSL